MLTITVKKITNQVYDKSKTKP